MRTGLVSFQSLSLQKETKIRVCFSNDVLRPTFFQSLQFIQVISQSVLVSASQTLDCVIELPESFEQEVAADREILTFLVEERLPVLRVDVIRAVADLELEEAKVCRKVNNQQHSVKVGESSRDPLLLHEAVQRVKLPLRLAVWPGLKLWFDAGKLQRLGELKNNNLLLRNQLKQLLNNSRSSKI